jgi:hypothetical protein
MKLPDFLSEKITKYLELLIYKEEQEKSNKDRIIKMVSEKREDIINSFNKLFTLNIEELAKLIIEFSNEEGNKISRIDSLINNDEFRYLIFNHYNIYIPKDIGFSRIIDNEKEIDLLDFKLRNFFKIVNDKINELKETKKDSDLIKNIELIYKRAKEEDLKSIDISNTERISMELGIYKDCEKNINIISGIIKNNLYNDILKDRIKNTFIPIKRLYISKETKQKIFERDNNSCKICGAKDYLELGHRKAVCNGGDDSLSNLITLCRKCNSHIGGKDIV